jgi:hypothetical protein
VDSLGSAWDMATGALSLAKGAISGLLGIVGSGIKVVTGFFSGIMEAAANWHNKAAPEMFQANQDIVKSFGNLDETQGKFVKSLTKELGPASNALKGASNSLFQAIGNGADILKEVTALAGDFGDDLVFLQEQIRGAASELLIMKKGMGLSGEAMKNLGSTAAASGGTLQDALNEGMVASAHLSKQFGVDVKLIGKGLNAMASDMKTFGHLSTKEMAAVATYTAKLGLEIKDLQGVMGQFDTFESAAQNAGKLAEAFGMNIDAMEMMNANNPAERIDMLRKSLQETGKSFDELSRHEKALMAQTSGMDMKALQNAMSVDVDEMGFDDFADAAEEAAEKITPEQAMKDVAKSIEKLSKSLTQMTSGPFSEMKRGFMQVIDRSPEMRAMMKQVSSWLKEFFKLGKKIGEMFMGFLRGPGNGILKQIQNIFNIERIQKFTDAIAGAFGTFFEDLQKDPKKAVENLFTNIKKAFTDWFSDTGDGASGFGEMLKNMLIGGIEMLGGFMPKIMEAMAEGIVWLTEGLRDLLEGRSSVSTVTDGVGGALASAFEGIKKVWIDKLWPAIVDLFALLWEKVQPIITKIWWMGIKWVFYRALFQAAASMLAGGIVAGVGKILSWVFSKISGKAQEKTQTDPKSTKTMWENFKEHVSGAAGINLKELGKAILAGTMIVVFLSVSLVAIAAAIYYAAGFLKKVDWMDFVKTIVMVGTAIIATKGLAKAAKGLNPAMFIQPGLGMLAGALFFTVSVGAYALAIRAIMAILAPVKFKDFIAATAMVTTAVLATYALAGAGALMIADGGITLLLGGLGLVAGATFFAVGVSAYAVAIKKVEKAMNGVNYLKFVANMSVMATAVTATLALAVVGALLGNPYGKGMLILAEFGLDDAANFLSTSFAIFARSLATGLDAFKGIPLTKVGIMMSNILLAIGAIVSLTAVGALFGVAGWFGLDKVIARGVAVMVEIADKSFPPLARVVKIIQSIPMQNPEEFQQKIDSIGKILEATQGLVRLSLDAAKMAIVASIFSDASPTEMMASMESFIVDSVNSISNMVALFVGLATGIKKEDIDKIGAVTSIISAVADLAGGLLDPMTRIVENQGITNLLSGDTASKQMTALAGGMADILVTLAVYIPVIIESLKTSINSIQNPKVFKEKADALGSLFNGLGAMAGAVGKLFFDAEEKGKGGWFKKDKGAKTILNDMFTTINDLLAPEGNIRKVIDTMVGMLTSLVFPELTQIEAFDKGTTAIIKVVESLVNLSDKLTFDKQLQLNNLGMLVSNWKNADGVSSFSPRHILKEIIDESVAIAALMKNVNTELITAKLEPLNGINGLLGTSAEKKITIQPKGVNITVNLSVTMDAGKVASQIVKGNEKTKGYFQLTEEAKAAELESKTHKVGKK